MVKNKKIKKYLKIKNYLDFLIRKLKEIFPNLEDKGERVDIKSIWRNITLSQNEKCHINRYEFSTSIIKEEDVVGDLACGTGYGSIIISKVAKKVIGVDLSKKVINKIKKLYSTIENVEFVESDLLITNYNDLFDCIVSFETIEHFNESDINKLLKIFHRALKKDGLFIFSTPYKQEESKKAINMGFHKTFEIDENKICSWLNQTSFSLEYFMYQNYDSCDIKKEQEYKDFIIVVAKNNK